uniref:Secreted protein n=1 Tax=Gossypium raimondii TaxID=29730 RepID=A0A0D2TDW2_GOSRA|nr:hypothetical protein B456_008G274400 [Gossypium raimondii]
MLCIVIMFLCLNSWVGHRYGLHVKSKLLSCFCYKGSQFIDGKLLGALIEHPKFTRFCWICNGKFHALNRVSYVKVTPSLNL